MMSTTKLILFILSYLVSFIIVFTFPLVLLLRFFISKIAIFCNPKFTKILSAHSANFASENINVTVCLEINGPLNYTQTLSLISERLIFLRNSKGHLIYPEFQQYAEYWFKYPFFKWENCFNIKSHIYVMDLSLDTELANYFDIEKKLNLTLKNFSRGESPWEIILIENKNKENHFCIFRFNHYLGDGHSIFTALSKCFDSPTSLVRPKKIHEKFFSIDKNSLFIPIKFLNAIANSIQNSLLGDDENVNYFSSLSQQSKSPTSHHEYDILKGAKLLDFKSKSNKLGVCLNSLLISSLAGAISKFLIFKKENYSNSNFPCTFPAHVPNHPQGLSNSLCFLNIDLPIKVNDIKERVKLIEELIRNEKDKKSGEASSFIASYLGALPKIHALRTFKLEPICFSIFPGPTAEIALGNQTVNDMYFFINGIKPIPCLLNSFTYNGTFRICACLDSNIGQSEIKKFKGFLDDEIQAHLLC